MNVRDIAKQHGIDLPDCGDSICIFGSAPGMRTNGGCRCDKSLPSKSTHTLRTGIHQLIQLIRKLPTQALDGK